MATPPNNSGYSRKFGTAEGLSIGFGKLIESEFRWRETKQTHHDYSGYAVYIDAFG
ncbi:MAG TPA: hypothetical protein VMC85_14510 [Desulfomonilaceae bacterium]|nr:hypothetical protein [Desulfomonilaceae bacterium]HVN77820.1 hypothetical protein [Terriglobia bacterium]HVO64952.1 hypothetical protein [Syntrophales bacterium]